MRCSLSLHTQRREWELMMTFGIHYLNPKMNCISLVWRTYQHFGWILSWADRYHYRNDGCHLQGLQPHLQEIGRGKIRFCNNYTHIIKVHSIKRVSSLDICPLFFYIVLVSVYPFICHDFCPLVCGVCIYDVFICYISPSVRPWASIDASSRSGTRKRKIIKQTHIKMGRVV